MHIGSNSLSYSISRKCYPCGSRDQVKSTFSKYSIFQFPFSSWFLARTHKSVVVPRQNSSPAMWRLGLLAGGKTTKLTHWVKQVIWFSKIAHHRPAHGESCSRQAVVGKCCCVWHSQCLDKHLWKDYCPDLFVNSIKDHNNPNIKLGW